jgi:flagellar biosynthesis protein FlhG
MKNSFSAASEASRMRSPKDANPGPVQVIAVTGGKGGVGKTSVALNLATGLAAAGRRVLLLDGDLGLANADVLLGIAPRYTLAHVLGGERTLEEVIVATPQGFDLVPAASGVAQLAVLSEAEHLGIVRAFSSLSRRLDVLIVDTAAGIGEGVLQFAQASQEVLLVIRDEPTSITDGYALIKVLSREHGVRRFRVLVNMSRRSGEGSTLFAKLERVTTRFLEVVLDYVGEIPEDTWMRRAIREQRPVIAAYPASPSALALKNLAAAADRWPVAEGPRGNLEFFVERLVQRRSPRLELVR